MEWGWCGRSLTNTVSADSFIVSCSIIHFYKDQKDISYVVFPDGKSVLGFLEYVLQRWSAHFNSNWLEEPGVRFSFLVHDGPEAVIRHRINWEDRDFSDDATKEIWGRPVEWLRSYTDEDIYRNPLMNKQFMKMLRREFSYSI